MLEFIIWYFICIIVAFGSIGSWNKLIMFEDELFGKISLREALVFSVLSWVTVFFIFVNVFVVVVMWCVIAIIESTYYKAFMKTTTEMFEAFWERFYTIFSKETQIEFKNFKSWFENK